MLNVIKYFIPRHNQLRKTYMPPILFGFFPPEDGQDWLEHVEKI